MIWERDFRALERWKRERGRFFIWERERERDFHLGKQNTSSHTWTVMIWDLFLLLMCLLWRPCKLRQTQIYDLSFPLTSNPIISFQRRLRSSSITTTLSVATPSSPHHGMTPPPLPIREENRKRERERERERESYQSFVSLDFVLGLWGVFKIFFLKFFV